MNVNFGSKLTGKKSFDELQAEKTTNGFKKRKYSLPWLVKDALAVFPRVHDIYSIAVKNRLPEEFREEIMVVVSRANGCTICNFTHHDFAQVAGVNIERLQQLEKADFSQVDEKRKLAFDFAVAKSLNQFGVIDKKLQEEFDKAYSGQERKDIEFVSRFITVMNLCCNKLEAFSYRIKDRPVKDSRFIDEVAISVVALSIIPVMYSLVAVARNESYWSVWKDYFTFADHYEETVEPVFSFDRFRELYK